MFVVLCKGAEVCWCLERWSQSRTELFTSTTPCEATPLISLNLNYITVARACLKLGRPMSAVFYSEVWCSSQFGAPLLRAPSLTEALQPLFHSAVVSKQESVLLSAHSALRDPDGPDGVASLSTSLNSRLHVVVHASDAVSALSLSSAMSSSGSVVRVPAVTCTTTPHVARCLVMSRRCVCCQFQGPTAWSLRMLGAYPTLHALVQASQGQSSGAPVQGMISAPAVLREELCEVSVHAMPAEDLSRA